MILKAGVIGLGMMGRHHARILSTLQGVQFVGSCEIDSRNDVFGQGMPIYRTVEEFCKQELDYAVIAVPTKYHLDVALKLVDCGIRALIEKPLAHDVLSSRKIVKAFHDAGLVGAVGHIERFNPAVREAKSRLEMLGSLYQITTSRQGPFPGRISDVGVVKDLATHDIDLTSWVTGQEFETVYAQTALKSGRAKEDMVTAVAKLNQETISNHVVNWLSPKKERLVTLIGEKGSFEIDTLNVDLTFYENGTTRTKWEDLARFRGVAEGDVVRFSFEKKEPLRLEHESFRDALLGKTNEIVTLEAGLRTVVVAEAMIESSVTGKAITVRNS